MSHLRRGLSLALALVAPVVAHTREAAVEPLVSGQTRRFEMQWPAGELEAGGDRGLVWQRIRTRGRREANFAAFSEPLNPPLDLRGRFPSLWIKVDATEHLAGLELRLTSDAFASYFAFAVPVYADRDANLVRDGSWTPLSFGFGSSRVVGAPDRSAIDRIGIFVADTGEPVTVWWSFLVFRNEPPEGVVSLTFDDGYDEHHDAAIWMSEYGFRGTAYVIPNGLGRPGYMSLEEVRELTERFSWEVAAHHETSFTELSPQELETTLLGVKQFLVTHGFASGAAHLAYPLGRQDDATVRPLVRKHFLTARIAGGGMETLPPADPHLLRVLNVTRETRPEEIGAAARRAREHRQWLILMFHYIVPEPRIATEYGIANFRSALREIVAAGVAVRPVGEVWRECCGTACLESDPRNQRGDGVSGLTAWDGG